MAIKLKRADLKKDEDGEYEYEYIWTKDKGDGEYTGTKDRVRIDKDEGYEVMYFIQEFMDKHSLKKVSEVHKIEKALHSDDLSDVVMRDELIEKIEEMLEL